MAIAIDNQKDRRVFLFESGERRTIMNEFAHLMAAVEPAEEVAAKAREYFNKHAPKVSAPALTKKKTTRRKAAASPSKAKSKRAAAKAKSAAE